MKIRRFFIIGEFFMKPFLDDIVHIRDNKKPSGNMSSTKK